MADDTSPLTRRRVLQLSAGIGMFGLAGCSETSEVPSTGESPSATPEEDSVFRHVGVNGDFLVIEVADSEAISKINLIAPDGTLSQQQSVQSGVQTVRFRLIKFESLRPIHYTPGEHELVAVDDGDIVESRSLELKPDLRIREITQYGEGDDPGAQTHLAVLVENTGTAPTWVYDITYRNAPYWGANDGLRTNQGISYLFRPKEEEDLILRPGRTQNYVSSGRSLLFSDTGDIKCDYSGTATVVLGIATGAVLEHRIRLTVSGQSTTLGGTSGYSCNDVSVEMLGVANVDKQIDSRGD